MRERDRCEDTRFEVVSRRSRVVRKENVLRNILPFVTTTMQATAVRGRLHQRGGATRRLQGRKIVTKAMLVRPYTVRKGDTLFKISQKRGNLQAKSV